jgi:putative transposase
VSRFRLYPTPAQADALLGHCKHARFVWNLGLEQRLMWRRGRGPTPGYLAQAAQLTEARKAEPWLAAGSQTVQQQALRDLDQAWKNFFAGTHRRPTWRKEGIHEGFQIVGAQASRVRQLNRKWSAVLVPKVGWVKFRRTRAVPDVKSYRVNLRAGQWHLAFAAVPEPVPAPGNGEIVGVDRGVVVTLAYSDGRRENAPKPLPVEALQRRLSRAKRKSKRRDRLRVKLGRRHARNARRLTDWVEQESTRVARSLDLIRVEDLRIANMTRSARGTLEEPGRNVAQKAGLNRSILRSGWGRFVTRLEQKAPGRVEKLNPAYTSITCSSCGRRARESRESQALFLCVACGHQANADVNAARNIAQGNTAVGRTVATRGGRTKSAQPVKREPQLATSSPSRS